MLITKFNKMIRNRLLWGIFAGIISVSFVGLFTSSGGCEGTGAAEIVAGTVDGLSVTEQELQRSRFFTTLHLSLMMGQPYFDQSPARLQELDQMAWRRVVALKKAFEMGLRATDQEVVAQIEKDPMFVVDGVFQRRFFNQFSDGFLRQVGVSRGQYEEFVRDEIVLEKLMRALTAAVWIAPPEMEQHLQTYTDVFEVQSVRFPANLSPEALVAPEEEILAEFFEEHAESFALPERVRIDYIAFKVADFMDGIEVDEEDVENYYADHLADFRRPDDDDPETVEGALTGFREFEEVADDIRERLMQRQALFAAMDAATEFVLQLVSSGRQTAAVSFADAAAARALPVQSSAPFSRLAPPLEPADIDPETLIRHAFRLEDNPDEYFSDAIAGESAAYVLALRERLPAGIPPLDDIADEVRAAFMQRRQRALMLEQAGDLRRAIMDAMYADSELTFEAAAAARGLDAVVHEPFSVFNAPDTLDDTDALFAIASLNPGEFTEVLSSQDGSLRLVYVMDRQAADEMSRSMLRRQIGTNLYRHRVQLAFAEWQDDLMRRLEKTERAPAPVDAQDDRDLGRRPVL